MLNVLHFVSLFLVTLPLCIMHEFNEIKLIICRFMRYSINLLLKKIIPSNSVRVFRFYN